MNVRDVLTPIDVACRPLRNDPRRLTREVFPRGMPVAIDESRHDHRKPLKGDCGIRCEPWTTTRHCTPSGSSH
jgi:hypothetical protein